MFGRLRFFVVCMSCAASSLCLVRVNQTAYYFINFVPLCFQPVHVFPVGVLPLIVKDVHKRFFIVLSPPCPDGIQVRY